MPAVFDPWTDRVARVRYHLEQQRYRLGDVQVEAMLRVLDLAPPQPVDEPTTEEAIAEDGWWACHATVVKTFAVALGIEEGATKR